MGRKERGSVKHTNKNGGGGNGKKLSKKARQREERARQRQKTESFGTEEEAMLRDNEEQEEQQQCPPQLMRGDDEQHRQAPKLATTAEVRTRITNEPIMRAPKGLPNLGNTCFFNSTMQCLLTNWPFLQHYFDIVLSMSGQSLCISSPFNARVGDTEVKVPSMEMHLPHNFPMPTFWVFKSFIDNFHKDDTSRPNPRELFDQISKKVPRFRGMAQQDAHELLHYLMNMLRQEELSRVQQAFSTIECDDANVVGDEEEDEMIDTGNSTEALVNGGECTSNNNFDTPGGKGQQNVREQRCNMRSRQQNKTANTRRTSVSRQERRRRLICQALLDGPAQPVIDAIYGGVLQQSIKCDRCSYVSVALEPFFDLTLPVKPLVAHGWNSSLEDALRLFTAEETLRGGDTNSYRCDNCCANKAKNMQQPSDKQSMSPLPANALKCYKVLSPPLVLTLHLNRFEQIGRNLRKFNGHVQFPLLLNLAPFCSANVNRLRPGQNRRLLLYRLCGVVSHSGGMGGGHYIAYVGRYPPRIDGDLSHCQPVDNLFELTFHCLSTTNSSLPSTEHLDIVQLADHLDTLGLENNNEQLQQPANADDDVNNNNRGNENDSATNETIQEQEFEQHALDAAKHQSKWFYCSDSHVRPARVDEVLKAQAFLLFYERIY